ncbi:MAG: iron-containing redox enzyme family protein [Gammaproteobacteria bacterium]|nr:iron-containing redox enzyme family protein [Gammaproteobacteria bacterium]
MSFFELLERETAEPRAALLASPVIADCLERRVGADSYAAFLAEAYHHVRHTVPLLMACGNRLPPRLEWLRRAVVDYIGEEYGHERWILNDLRAIGRDAEAVAAGMPSAATETMVAYAYDTVQRGNPVGFFGMVYVLEGTSVAIATRAARIIQQELALPDRAFSYLLSHGSVDVEHVARLTSLLNRLDEHEDRAAVLHAARMFFRLYRGVFDALPRARGAGPIDDSDATAAATRREVA